MSGKDSSCHPPGPPAILSYARTCSSGCLYPAYILKLLIYTVSPRREFPRILRSSYRNPILLLACLKQEVPLAEVFCRDLVDISRVNPLDLGTISSESTAQVVLSCIRPAAAHVGSEIADQPGQGPPSQ